MEATRTHKDVRQAKGIGFGEVRKKRELQRVAFATAGEVWLMLD